MNDSLEFSYEKYILVMCRNNKNYTLLVDEWSLTVSIILGLKCNGCCALYGRFSRNGLVLLTTPLSSLHSLIHSPPHSPSIHSHSCSSDHFQCSSCRV